MAALTMPRKRRALFRIQEIDVPEIPRRSIRIRVRRLPPLSMSFLVAMRTVLGRGKAFGVDELAVVSPKVGRQERLVGPKMICVFLCDLPGITSASV
jgi:hypothetical protein